MRTQERDQTLLQILSEKNTITVQAVSYTHLDVYKRQLNGLSDIRAKETVTLFDHKRPNGTKWSTILKENNVSYTNAVVLS